MPPRKKKAPVAALAPLRVRLAGPEDRPVILEFVREMVARYPVDEASVLGTLAAIEAHPREAAVLVALDGDRPAGMALVQVGPMLFNHALLGAQAHALYVRPDFRRQGVARALIDGVCQWARLRGTMGVRLGCDIGPELEAFRRLAAGAGFQEREVWFAKE